MSYDTKCLQLSVAFLDDHPEIKTVPNAEALAQEIQTSIEDWIWDKEVEQRELNEHAH